MKEESNALIDDGNDKLNGERQKNYTSRMYDYQCFMQRAVMPSSGRVISF